MILTGNEIVKNKKNGSILIEPFDIGMITTNSYDLTLGGQLMRYDDDILDPRVKPKTTSIQIPEDGYVINRGEFLLGSSLEMVGSDHYVPIVHAKSSIARLGLFIHITSGLFDIGSKCNVTFHFYATMPIKVYKGMKIAQITFWKPKGIIELYNGKYNNDIGISPSKIYLDFEKKMSLS